MALPLLRNTEEGNNIFIGEAGAPPINAPELYWIHEFSADVAKRELFIYGEINEEFGTKFLTTFRHLVSRSHEPVTIWLNTMGGDVEVAFMFYDLVSASPAPVTIIGTGSVVSAGVLMLACGHKVFVTESCSMMNHESSFSGEVVLRHSEAKDRRKWEDWTSERFVCLLGRCTSRRKSEKDESYWRKVTDKKAEHWILGGEAIVAEGLADAILNPERLKELKS